MDTRTPFRLKSDVLRPLIGKSNLPGVLRAGGHFGAIAAAAVALWWWRDTIWAVPLTVLLGYFIAFLFNVVHETAHQTAFKTRALNYIVGHVAAFAIFLPYEYYRAYHWDHHRYTQDPDRDPELATPLPTTALAIAWQWSGLPFWWSRLRMLWRHGAMGQVTARWVPEDKRPMIVREARTYLLIYAAIAGISLATQSWMAVCLWILPVMAGQFLLRPYLAAEHTGCDHSADMLANTRTTYTNSIVRFFAWNMPYHAEHHAYPVVPFHALPKLNAALAANILHTEPGYRRATVTVVRSLVGAELLQESEKAESTS